MNPLGVLGLTLTPAAKKTGKLGSRMCAVSRLGRPSRLTPAVADAIVEAVRNGATVKTAAATVGVGRRTVYDWLEQGRREPHGRFVARLEAALDEARQPSWQQALAVLDSEFEHWELPPLREVLRDVDVDADLGLD
jgi:transposase-like protein